MIIGIPGSPFRVRVDSGMIWSASTKHIVYA